MNRSTRKTSHHRAYMDFSSTSEGPTILHLQKWGPSEFQFNLSEFREAFISPTRELLLLLSYQREALLVPLVKGEDLNVKESENCIYENIQDPNSVASCSTEFAAHRRSDLRENVSRSSESVKMVSDNDFSLDINSARTNNYPFVCDVNSLAWGICGDTYNHHEETSFKELLFVSGEQGVTVHAFCQPSTARKVTESTMDSGIGEGIWVEWGPSAAFHDMEAIEHSRLHSEASRDYVNNNSETGETLNTLFVEAEEDELAITVARKQWLRTFLTKVETSKSEGNMWTRFPKKSSFPSTARVVSFSIFGSDFPLLGFLSDGRPLSPEKESHNDLFLDLVNNTYIDPGTSSSGRVIEFDAASNSSTATRSTSYKCSRLFSSNSHRLIGFVLILVDSEPVNTCDGPERNKSKILLIVARLFSRGIQWVSSVKLDECFDGGSVYEWTDFGFSDNFLICLNAAGLIYFYGAMSGEHVAHLDLLQIHGLQLHSQDQDKLRVQGDVAPFFQTCDFVGKKVFKRLLVASLTSCFAVVDEHGVIYVVCAGEHVQRKCFSIERSVQPIQHTGLGKFISWEVGGADISHQRVLSNISGCNNSNNSERGKPSSMDTVGSRELCKIQDRKGQLGQYDLHIRGFTSALQMMEQKFHCSKLPLRRMREIFVPRYRFKGDDVICFSSLGITQLNKKHNSMSKRCSQLLHSYLHVDSTMNDDKCFDLQGWEASVGEAVGCTFQGCFYLVTKSGLSVVLPSVSVSSNLCPIEAIGYRQTSISVDTVHQAGDLPDMKGLKQPWSPSKAEVLDRILLYEGPKEADHLCIENGWDLKISHMRRLQLALDYLKFEEIEISLEMLEGVNLAEEGILKLLFAVVFLMYQKVGNDSEVAAASRLLTLATSFATKMIRKYGFWQYKKDAFMAQGVKSIQSYAVASVLPPKDNNDKGNSRKLREMAHFLEIIRNLQCRLSTKFRGPVQGLVDDVGALSSLNTDFPEDDHELSILPADALLLETSKQHKPSILASDMDSDNAEKLALVPMDSLDSKAHPDLENFSGASILVSEGSIFARKVFPLENPKDMITRWEIDNLDQINVVKDALLSGRLPLAVLKLHLYRLRDLATEKQPHDTFTEVRDIGRAIAYDLFLKGETGLAVTTLQKLGEDIESCLKQLVFGTIRRSLRMQIAEEMNRYGYLGSYEWKILGRILLIERLYPSGSFWRTFCARQKEFMRVPSINSPEEVNLRLLRSQFISLVIECGDIDGVVLGSWTNVNEHSGDPVVDDDSAHAGYWAAAAVWSDAWDQRTIDRIVLDQPFLMGVNVLWESQLEYHMCHNDWVEVSKLLDVIPSYSLSSGSLQITLDDLHSALAVGCDGGLTDSGNYTYSVEELDDVWKNVPGVRIFRFSANNMCSTWLRTFMEQQLARKFIFLKEYWEGTSEIVSLLARSGFITSMDRISFLAESFESSSDGDLSITSGEIHPEVVHALHKLVIHHCVQYNLPNLLDLYLDHHKLALDDGSLSVLLDAAGNCEWAKWLVFLRVKGHEYDASFSNARAIALRNLVPDNKLVVTEIDDIIRTVDDIAEGAGEMAALATLIYAPFPIQDCLSSGSVSRHCSTSAQCTLENLRPVFQRFPTLWRTLVSACLGQDPTCNFLGPKTKVFSNSDLSDYLNWRDNIFFSAGRDTSLLQMLPCWFSKSIRRLVQLYVQGPLGWQSLAGLHTGESFLLGDINYLVNADVHAEISPMSWEAAIQKHVEEELYASSLEEIGLGLEHYLHRGRALAAFNHLLAARVQKLKLESNIEGHSGASGHGQTNIQSDVHTLLVPITESEESLLSSVMPLAILHFEDSVLVASCAFLLELCGLSASLLRINIAALRRISSFYKSSHSSDHFRQISIGGSAFHSISLEGDVTDSLARALADDYLHDDGAGVIKPKERTNTFTNRQPSRALMLVLQHLEKVNLSILADGTTCGSWLLNGNGDGAELRSQQKAASQHWNLVTVFCQMHQIPLSTKYLALLARDNDWVGFLSEAQVGGYPFETVTRVASKEFSDPRLKVHLLTVLKGMQSRKKIASSSNSDITESRCETSLSDEKTYIPVELFGIIAECEKQKNPGGALLVKAKDLCWSILAMIASCFPDASALSCLTVWLEITAARETSSIKVNDLASQIANNVEAAVRATNSLPLSGRALAFHYNRRNPKRRRLMEPMSVDPVRTTVSDISATLSSTKIFAAQDTTAEEETKEQAGEHSKVSSDSNEVPVSLSKMVAVLCEQRLFLPLLRAFELFLPSCSLLPFIRALQAFSQMRLSEASAHLGSFSARIKEEPFHVQTNMGREGQIGTSWITSTAVKAADAMLSTCPSPYEKRCLLQLLASTDFGDGGSAATYYRRLYWKINLAEPSLRKDDNLHLGNESLDDSSLLTALEKNGHWEQARNWARQLEASGGPWKSVVHRVTETQAESMVAEWKEFLWDVPEERVALWGHCQTLFLRYSFPALQAGLFFLKHAGSVEKDLPARELHELLLLSLQWLSGMITQSNPVYPLNLLREIETRVWLLAVESEAQVKSEGDFTLNSFIREPWAEKGSNIIDSTASIITKMDSHIAARMKATERSDARENIQTYHKFAQVVDASFSTTSGVSTKTKRRAKGFVPSRRPLIDAVDKTPESEDGILPLNPRSDLHLQDENFRIEASFSRWEERVGPAELERAVLSLLDFGQILAAKQLQHKLSPSHIPSEVLLVDAAMKLASISTPGGEISISMLDDEAYSVIQSYNLATDRHLIVPLQVLESLATMIVEGRGRGLCKKIISVVKVANVLGLSFSEAFEKLPIELLQLLSLKAQDSFEEAKLLVKTHSMPAASIAQILAESFLKGLLAAHRGGYMDNQKEEGPAPLLWRFSDFLKWAELCSSEPEIGHALMRLVITGQEIPHACEVELLILSHHFYKSSACLDGVDVLVALAATRVDAYVSEGDFPCLARLITGVGNVHALNFILGILIENGQLDLLLQKYSAVADTNTGPAEAVRGFRMSVLTSLKQFNPNDLYAFAMVYNHFDMKHETASLLELRAEQSSQQWFLRYDRDQNEDLLESMRYFIEAAEVHSSIDAGNKTRAACAQASLVSLQIRMPDFQWLNLSDTNARRALVEQSRFQEALIVAEAYGLNQPSEWALVLWNQMLKPELIEEFVAEFVAVLPLQPSMLAELARFYRAEVAARGDQSHFSVWLTGGGLPAEWAKYLGRSFRCLLKKARDLRLRVQLATVATGFGDVIDACVKVLDKVPDNAGPLVLRKGHGGGYLPLM
ncbi:unnamed protein product [Ilex paraguariensis]|uniref:Spatacsin C-terminal domain-containing protein n=1 Tax=Ilex paraguariensis TaxID=185542 RepID=A0ABC8QYZ8_9AQUA